MMPRANTAMVPLPILELKGDRAMAEIAYLTRVSSVAGDTAVDSGERRNFADHNFARERVERSRRTCHPCRHVAAADCTCRRHVSPQTSRVLSVDHRYRNGHLLADHTRRMPGRPMVTPGPRNIAGRRGRLRSREKRKTSRSEGGLSS